MHLHTRFSAYARVWSRPASVSNNLGFFKVRAYGAPRVARNQAELAIPQTPLPGSRRVLRGKLSGSSFTRVRYLLCV